jgi:N-acetylmuramoyl-L-alanine amidase
VRRLLPLTTLLLLLALAGATTGGGTTAGTCVSATPTEGAAPLAVSLSTPCPAQSWHWDFGDGTTADTQAASHTFAGGTWTVTLTLTQADGSQSEESAQVVADGIVLRAPRSAAYKQRATLRGKVVSGTAGSSVTLFAGSRAIGGAPIGPGGGFTLHPRIRTPGPYRVTSGGLASNRVSLVVRPSVSVRVTGGTALGGSATVVARVEPAAAGRLVIAIRSGTKTVAQASGRGVVHVRLAARAPGSYRVAARLVPAAGWAAAAKALVVPVTVPQLQRGATGPAVHALEERLTTLHYALERVDSAFGQDTYDAVVAFQKVNGLARTGVVSFGDWRVLLRSGVPSAQVTGDAIEVDKTRQVLFVVRHGEAQLVIPVSTGATGNTPIGEFHVYRKVNGWDWVLYYPSYFLRGFAVHGYVDVPTYPASHGCVRIPIWVSQRISSLIPYGSRIVIHY